MNGIKNNQLWFLYVLPTYTGDSPLTLRWLKDGEPLPPILGANITSLDQYSSLLSIPSLSAKHSGDYTCVATNPAAETKFNASLQVKGIVYDARVFYKKWNTQLYTQYKYILIFYLWNYYRIYQVLYLIHIIFTPHTCADCDCEAPSQARSPSLYLAFSLFYQFINYCFCFRMLRQKQHNATKIIHSSKMHANLLVLNQFKTRASVFGWIYCIFWMCISIIQKNKMHQSVDVANQFLLLLHTVNGYAFSCASFNDMVLALNVWLSILLSIDYGNCFSH